LEGLADSYYFSGNLELAREIYTDLYNKQSKNQRLNGIYHVKVLQFLLATSPKEDELSRLIHLIKDIQNSGSDKAIYSYRLALTLAHKNQNEMAIRYLVQSVEQGLSSVDKVIKNPLYKKLTSLSSYQQVIAILKAKQNITNKQMSNELTFWQTYTLLSQD